MPSKHLKLQLTAAALTATLSMAHAADVVVQPSAGSALVVTDSTGGSPRLRVQEDGKISIPGWQSLPPQSGPMCIDLTLGLIGPCASTSGFSLPFAATAASPGALFALTQAGAGGGIQLTLPASNNSPAINVQHQGTGAGVRVQTGGFSVWGQTNVQTSAAIVGDNSAGEAIVGRQSGAGCNSSTNKCKGIGAVVGRHDGEGGYGVRGFVTHPNGAIGVLGQAGNHSGGQGVAGRFENLNAANTHETLQVETNGVGAAAAIRGGTATQDLLVLASSGVNVARIDKTGRGFFNGGTQTGGADIAEIIDTTGRLPEPGEVVEIDPEHPSHYRLSSMAESTLVAGVVTTRPGVLMNAGVDDVAGLPALALAGRVPVKVTAEGGAIRAGDLLVSASTPGHAMKAPAPLVPGTVIGKALQDFSAHDPGVIEMLVMLR